MFHIAISLVSFVLLRGWCGQGDALLAIGNNDQDAGRTAVYLSGQIMNCCPRNTWLTGVC